jgi:hypothetical protein
MMTRQMMFAAAGAALLLAGCAKVPAPSGPPTAGTSSGPGAPPPASAPPADSIGGVPGSIGGYPLIGPRSQGGP